MTDLPDWDDDAVMLAWLKTMLPGGEHPDIFWSYLDPLPQVGEIAGYLSFYDDRFEVQIDGAPVTGR